MNIDEARIRFGAPELCYAQEAVEANGDTPARAATTAISLLTIRSQPPPAEIAEEDREIAQNYGVLANASFFNAVFNTENDSVFKQLVVYNCNAGAFRPVMSNTNAVKMFQLLSLGRLGKAGLLPVQTETKASYYQALALAEGMGPCIPAAWKIDQFQSRREIIEAVRWLLSAEGEAATGLTKAEWHNAEILGVDDDVFAHAWQMQIDQALVLLEGMAVAMPTNENWLNGVSYITSALASICKRGLLSDDHRKKIIEEVREATSSGTIFLNKLTIKRFYGLYCGRINAANADALITHYRGLISEDIIMLRNIIIQAAGSGLTAYMTIVRALHSFADFKWPLINMIVPVDFANLQTAVNTVGGSVYFGIFPHISNASPRRFPSLAYCAFQLCMKVNGDRLLARYQSMPREVPAKAELDRLIDAYTNRHTEPVEMQVVVPDDIRVATAAIREQASAAFTRMMAPPPAEA